MVTKKKRLTADEIETARVGFKEGLPLDVLATNAGTTILNLKKKLGLVKSRTNGHKNVEFPNETNDGPSGKIFTFDTEVSESKQKATDALNRLADAHEAQASVYRQQAIQIGAR